MSNPALKLPTLNQVTFTGRIDTVPEPLLDTNGTMRFSVAIPRRRAGEDDTLVLCVASGALAEAVLAKSHPGCALLISGALSTRGAAAQLHVHVTALQFLEHSP